MTDRAPEPYDDDVVADAVRQLAEILAAVERRDLDATRGQRNRLVGAVAAMSALRRG